MPIYFSKVPESVVGPGAPIVIVPEVSTAIDYEAELAVVIGQGGKGAVSCTLSIEMAGPAGGTGSPRDKASMIGSAPKGR